MHSLLTIAPPSPEFPPDVLDSPGGFAWWYTDMVDARGNGLVLIWSFGLPFLPGYAAAARRGCPQLPRERPSLNVAVMQEGQLACYLLQEVAPDRARWSGSTWQIGDSTFVAGQEGGMRTLRAVLDCPLPGGERLRGEVEVAGPARQASDADRSTGHHDWAPMAGPARASARIAAAGADYELEGRGYFDGNYGRAPLDTAGIAAWTWGRLPREDRESVYYILWRDLSQPPEAHAVEIDGQGRLTRSRLDVEIRSHRRGFAGLRHPAEVVLRREGAVWAHVRVTSVLDDGPFYLRYLIEAEGVLGLGEFCRTDRIDLSRHRPLVRMRVHQADAENSMWLPLFTGPRPGRLQRFLRELGG